MGHPSQAACHKIQSYERGNSLGGREGGSITGERTVAAKGMQPINFMMKPTVTAICISTTASDIQNVSFQANAGVKPHIGIPSSHGSEHSVCN
jgi:hypothetical protein